MKCIRCGRDGFSRRIYYSCMEKWRSRRTLAFAKAQEKLGPLSAENLKAIQKEVKRLEALPDAGTKGK